MTKKSSILKFEIISTIFIMIAGTLLHFTFEWSNNNPIVGTFSAVNESTWEHLKLLFFPMLISSIIIFPALTSMRVFKSFKHVVISSGVVSVVSFLIGIYLSYIYNISTGATIVLVNLVLFILFSIVERIIHE